MNQSFSRLEVLGCSGGVGIPGEGTTCFLLDEDVLLDAGTGLFGLGLERMSKIRHVVLTHSHLDHICGIPLLVDSVPKNQDAPLMIHGLPETLNALRAHIFNDVIWPDFSRIPSPQAPYIQYCAIPAGGSVTLGERRVRTIPVPHTVPGVALVVETPTGAWAFSGDTHCSEVFYEGLNALPQLKDVLIESAFPDHERWLADLAQHLCPSLLSQELSKLKPDVRVWVTHMKPFERDLIQSEIVARCKPGVRGPHIRQELGFLATGQVFHI